VTEHPVPPGLTEGEFAELRALAQAFVNQPVLRTCLYPECLRQYDAAANLAGREPERPSWSGDGWRKVTRGPATGDLCPDHTAIVTRHLPRTAGLPNGRWAVVCACEWMSRPQTYGGLLRPLWEEHLLLAAGALAVPVALAETPARRPLEDHTEATLAELYDDLTDALYYNEEIRDAAQAMYRSWDWHRQALAGVIGAVHAVGNIMRVDSRDWAADRTDAYLYAVLIGWDDAALTEVAARHRWDGHRVAYVRDKRAHLARFVGPVEQQEKEA